MHKRDREPAAAGDSRCRADVVAENFHSPLSPCRGLASLIQTRSWGSASLHPRLAPRARQPLASRCRRRKLSFTTIARCRGLASLIQTRSWGSASLHPRLAPRARQPLASRCRRRKLSFTTVARCRGLASLIVTAILGFRCASPQALFCRLRRRLVEQFIPTRCTTRLKPPQ